jgi:hypothetical protein
MRVCLQILILCWAVVPVPRSFGTSLRELSYRCPSRFRTLRVAVRLAAKLTCDSCFSKIAKNTRLTPNSPNSETLLSYDSSRATSMRVASGRPPERIPNDYFQA